MCSLEFGSLTALFRTEGVDKYVSEVDEAVVLDGRSRWPAVAEEVRC